MGLIFVDSDAGCKTNEDGCKSRAEPLNI